MVLAKREYVLKLAPSPWEPARPKRCAPFTTSLEGRLKIRSVYETLQESTFHHHGLQMASELSSKWASKWHHNRHRLKNENGALVWEGSSFSQRQASQNPVKTHVSQHTLSNIIFLRLLWTNTPQNESQNDPIWGLSWVVKSTYFHFLSSCGPFSCLVQATWCLFCQAVWKWLPKCIKCYHITTQTFSKWGAFLKVLFTVFGHLLYENSRNGAQIIKLSSKQRCQYVKYFHTKIETSPHN